MTFVKICGNRRPDDVAMARDADAIGVVVASPKSPRSVSLDTAERLLGGVGPFQTRVAVTSSTDRATLLALARIADAVQCPAAGSRAVEAVRKEAPGVRFLLATRPERWADAVERADAVVLDALTDDGYGGTGRRVDERAARAVVEACPRPVVLAGGLTPENVAASVRAVRPYAVDVSGGVETDGVKDPERVAAFIRAARGTDLRAFTGGMV